MTRYLIATVLATAVIGTAGCSELKPGAARMPSGWRLAMMAYTFRNFTLFEGIDKTHELGLKYLEGFSWHKIGGPCGDAKFDDTASPKGPPTLCQENSSRYSRPRALVLSMPSYIGKLRKV